MVDIRPQPFGTGSLDQVIGIGPAQAQFSDDQLEVLREAQRRGKLSEAQKKKVVEAQRETEIARSLIDDPELLKAAGLADLTAGMISRPASEMAGALAGTVAGAKAGAIGGSILGPFGTAGGALLGGAAGAFAGSFAFDTVEDAAKQFGVIRGPRQTVGEALETAGEAAFLDLAFATGATVIRPVLGMRNLFSKMFRVGSEEAKRIQTIAGLHGIGLGAADVGGAVPKIANRVVNIFPFTGAPAQKAFIGKQEQVTKAFGKMLNEMAPTATVTSELGVDLAKAARNTRGEFIRVSGMLYKNVDDTVRNVSRQDIVPTQTVKEQVKAFLEQEGRSGILLETGEALPRAVRTQADEFIKNLRQLPETVTVDQYRRLQRDVRDLANMLEGQNLDMSRVMQVKKALETDFANLRVDLLPESEAARVTEALQTANSFFARGVVDFSVPGGKATLKTDLPPGFKGQPTFETPTAQRFERVDKNIFRQGPNRPRSLNPDELANITVRLKSPEALRDLEALVGPELLTRAGRSHLDEAIKQSTEVVKIAGDDVSMINPFKLEEVLGLGRRTKQELEGLRFLFKRAGIDFDDFKELIDVAKSIEGVGNPSQFVARRVTLGGVGSIAGAAGIGAAAGGAAGGAAGITAAGLLTLAGRKASQIISSPEALKNMTTALDTRLDTAVRRAAYARVLKFLATPEEGASSSGTEGLTITGRPSEDGP